MRQKAAAAGPGTKPGTKALAKPGTKARALPAKPIVGETAPKRRRKAPASRLDTLQRLVLASLEDDKAGDAVVLDLVGRASFADRMVIATGLSDRQIATMARHLEERLKEAGFPRLAIEGRQGADWVLVDAGDIVVHLFKPEARALYALERMWGAELGPEEQVSAG
ncbi:MAG: ribosome silencing factor [Acetobacteraceae bacterium]